MNKPRAMKAGPVAGLVSVECWASTYTAYQVDLVFDAIIATKLSWKMCRILPCQVFRMGSSPTEGSLHLLLLKSICKSVQKASTCQARVHGPGERSG